MKEMLHFFGYAKVPTDPENITGFYEYHDLNQEMSCLYKGWKAQNVDILDWVC